MSKKSICFLALLVPAAVLGLWLGRARAQGPGAAPFRPRVPEDLELIPDVVYWRAGERELHLDILRPKNPPAGKLPVIVYIHGGAWMSGSHRNPTNLRLARQGYFTVNVEYRLSGEAVWPAQIHDCKAAIRWLRANAEKYHLDPDRIGVWGHSAGGHLVALLGTSGEVKELEGENGNAGFSSRVSCVVDCFGPTDFAKMEGQPSNLRHMDPDSPESRLLGKPVREAAELVRQANPIPYIDRKDPPFLILHGDADMTVPFNQSEILNEALKKAGVDVTFTPVRGAGHGGPQFSSPQVLEQIGAFFARHLKG